MKKKMGIFKKKYIPGALCIAVFIIAFVSAGVNLSAVKNDRGIYYRNDLPGTYVLRKKRIPITKNSTAQGKRRKTGCSMRCCFGAIMGKGRWKALN